MPYLSVAQRGFVSMFDLVEKVNAILYKLKSGCQWRMLPVGHLFSGKAPSHITVFKHYRKWCRNGDWEYAFSQNLKENKDKVDLSLAHIDGSHTPVCRGGEKAEYQGRKKRNTTNALYLSDRQGLPLAMSEPQAGNHTDLYEIESRIDEIATQLRNAEIPVDGLFANLDAGFDGEKLRIALDSHGIVSNVCPNRRNGADSSEKYFFDEEMYKERWVVERTNAWMDGFKAVLIRFYTTVSSWKGWNYLAFLVIFIKKIHNSLK